MATLAAASASRWREASRLHAAYERAESDLARGEDLGRPVALADHDAVVLHRGDLNAIVAAAAAE